MEYCSFPLAPLATCRPALLQANYDHVAQSAVHDEAGGVAQRFLPRLLVGELVGLDSGTGAYLSDAVRMQLPSLPHARRLDARPLALGISN